MTVGKKKKEEIRRIAHLLVRSHPVRVRVYRYCGGGPEMLSRGKFNELSRKRYWWSGTNSAVLKSGPIYFALDGRTSPGERISKYDFRLLAGKTLEGLVNRESASSSSSVVAQRRRGPGHLCTRTKGRGGACVWDSVIYDEPAGRPEKRTIDHGQMEGEIAFFGARVRV